MYSGMKIKWLLAVGAFAFSITAFAGTQVETFEDGVLSGVWLYGNPFGGSQPGSFVIEDGRGIFRKTGDTAGITEYIAMGLAGQDNRIPPPWTVEYTLPDATQLVSNGGYFFHRFWKPGEPVMDWVTLSNVNGNIVVGMPGSAALHSIAAATTTSLKVKFEVETSGLTVYIAANGGAYSAGESVAWQSPVATDTIVGINFAALDHFGPTVLGPFEIAIDDLTISGPSIPDTPDPTDHPRWNPAVPDIGATNLVPNGSFESGAAGWSSIGKQTAWGGDLTSLFGEVVTGDAYDGAHSLKIELGPGKTPITHFDGWPMARVVQNAPLATNIGWLQAEFGAHYTLSAYMRADRAGVPALMTFRFGTDPSTHAWPSARNKSVTLTEEWTRYSFTVTAEEADLFVSLGPNLSSPDAEATVWIDAIQVERAAAPSDFTAREPVELMIDTAYLGDVLPLAGPPMATIFGSNTTGDAVSVTVTAQLEDYYGVELASSQATIEIPAGGSAEQALPLITAGKGQYRAQFTWETPGGVEHEKVLIITVVEPYTLGDSPFGVNHAPPTQELTHLLTTLGVAWTRDCAFDWHELEPTQGNLSFDRTDEQIDREAAAGMNSMAIMPVFAATEWNTEAPADASGPGWVRRSYAPEEPQDLFDFVGAAVAHYADRVEYYEFINEPVWIPFEGGNLSNIYGYTVQDYLELLQGAYPAMKTADPDCKMLGGLSIQAEMPLGDTFISAGGLQYCDIYNLHPYPTPNQAPERFIGNMNRILGVMDANGGRKPIWATEGGYFSEDDLPWTPWVAPPGHNGAVNLTTAGEKVAGDYGVRLAAILLAHNVEKIYYHQGIDGEVNNGSYELDNALMGPLATPKKFLVGLSALAHALGTAPTNGTPLVKAGDVNGQSTTSIYGFAFDRAEGGSALVAWNSQVGGANWILRAPQGLLQRDTVGNPILSNDVPLSGSPVHLISASMNAAELAAACTLQLSIASYDPDSDGDGLYDSFEQCFDGNCDDYNPYSAGNPDGGDLNRSSEDSDDDGLTDYEEVAIYHTNPLNSDSDDDGMPDGWEVANGLDPLADDAGADADGDGVSNGLEFEYGTDPQDEDSFPAAANLTVDLNEITLTEAAPSASFTVMNDGELPLAWEIQGISGVLTVQPTSGTGQQAIEVSASDFTAAAEIALTIQNTTSLSDTEMVTVQIVRSLLPADLAVSTQLLMLTEAAPTASFNVLNLGELPLSWTVSSDTISVSAAPDSGTGEQQVVVTATDFTESITANLSVVNDANPQDSATVVVQIARTPMPGDLDVSTNQVALTESAPSSSFNVLNLGETSIDWEVTSDTTSVTAAPSFGSDETEVVVTALDFAADITANLTVQNVAVASDNETVIVNVTHTPVPSNLGVSSTLVTLNENSPTASVNILNSGELPLFWTATSDVPNVIVAPGAGQGGATITITATNFTTEQTANITVANDNDVTDTETIVVQVQRSATPGDLDVSSNALTLTEDAPETQFNVLNLGETALDWTVTSDSAVVAVTPAGGTDDGAVTVSASDFAADLTVNLAVRNLNDNTDTETVVVTVVAAAPPPTPGCPGFGGSTGPTAGGDNLLFGAVLATLVGLTLWRRQRLILRSKEQAHTNHL